MDARLEETTLLEMLRQRDEAAFTQIVEQYHSSLVRLATIYVQDITSAEEVAQETWLAVLQGLHRFEGRSSLKTWIFTILTNKAKTRGERENRTLPFSALVEASPNEPTVDQTRFNHSSAEKWPGHWAPGSAPVSWEGVPEEQLLLRETLNVILEAINRLPENQRLVITLHDQDELSQQEICNILEISETNQRVLLHRARSRVRQALENYLKTV